MRIALFLPLFFLFISCAKSPVEAENEAIDIAHDYMSAMECEKAIDILEDVGRNYDNAYYVEALGAAYSCKADFQEIPFVENDLVNMDTDAADLFKSLAVFPLAKVERAALSTEYVAMREALSVLLKTDKQTVRNNKFGPRKAGDLGVQALLLALNQLGKFLNFYGNVDATGEKGLGAANTDEQGATASTCFIEYTEASALAFLAGGGGGICNDMGTDDGHPNLSLIPASLTATKARMCEGLMLVTNIIDIIDNISLPDDPSFSSLDDLGSTVTSYKNTISAVNPALSTLLNTTSQASCESLVANATEFDNLQLIFAMMFEGGLQ